MFVLVYMHVYCFVSICQNKSSCYSCTTVPVTCL
uniref:Uncharacterized protein n=1 Tax=Anguilla anguilla TaxID=7936 RepID=A0A0E9PJS3_ANGAN